MFECLELCKRGADQELPYLLPLRYSSVLASSIPATYPRPVYSQHTRWHLILIAELARVELRLSQVRCGQVLGPDLVGPVLCDIVRCSASKWKNSATLLAIEWNLKPLYFHYLIYQLLCVLLLGSRHCCATDLLLWDAIATDLPLWDASANLRPCATTCATVLPLWSVSTTNLATLCNHLHNY